MLTVERLKELLHYDPETGIWIRLSTESFNHTLVGKRAGGLNKHGYIQIRVDGKLYSSNMLAWLYMTGEWPTKIIDHHDLNRSNDRWSNLREATRTENGANAKISINNSSGHKRISWHKATKKWRADIGINNKQVALGLFSTKEEAISAYDDAAINHFGEFARTE